MWLGALIKPYNAYYITIAFRIVTLPLHSSICSIAICVKPVTWFCVFNTRMFTIDFCKEFSCYSCWRQLPELCVHHSPALAGLFYCTRQPVALARHIQSRFLHVAWLLFSSGLFYRKDCSLKKYFLIEFSFNRIISPIYFTISNNKMTFTSNRSPNRREDIYFSFFSNFIAPTRSCVFQ